MAADSEYSGAGDGLFGNVALGAPVTPYLAAVSLRQSAREGRIDSRGQGIPTSPRYGTSTRLG